MILFFYGEDTYRLNQKLRELKEKFISASLGDTNLSIIEGKTATFDEITRQILAMPFLSKKRLVIIRNLLSEGKKSAKDGSASGREVIDKMTDFLSKTPEATVAVFVEEGVPDRRTALFKKLNKPKISHSTSSVQAQEFKLLENEALRRWVIREIEMRDAKCEPAAISKLIDYVGNDLWRMSNEIKKLASYSKKITQENIELLVQPQIHSNIFDLMDAIASRNLGKSMKELYQLFNDGKAEQYILSMIVLEYRNLLITKDFEQRSDDGLNKWVLAKKAGLHPYVAQKTLALATKYEMEDLKKIYGVLLNFDHRIKTGKIEPKVALELLIYKLTTQKSEIRSTKS